MPSIDFNWGYVASNVIQDGKSHLLGIHALFFPLFLFFNFGLGGLPRGSYIRILLHTTITFSSGMRILGLKTFTLRGEYIYYVYELVSLWYNTIEK